MRKQIVNAKKMEEISWEEFRDSGMIWFINRMLHIFGLSIIYTFENSKIVRVFPARVKIRGFDADIESSGFISVTNYLDKNISALKKETDEKNNNN